MCMCLCEKVFLSILTTSMPLLHHLVGWNSGHDFLLELFSHTMLVFGTSGRLKCIDCFVRQYLARVVCFLDPQGIQDGNCCDVSCLRMFLSSWARRLRHYVSLLCAFWHYALTKTIKWTSNQVGLPAKFKHITKQ